MLVIEECANTRAVTVFIRGSNKMVSPEKPDFSYIGFARTLTAILMRFVVDHRRGQAGVA